MTLFDPRTELYINGAWVDVSSYVRYASGVQINRGRPDGQGEVVPSSLSLSLNNRDGRFSNRNPTSSYYGLLGRNTPIRQSVAGFAMHLRLDGQGYATTPDAAALDIVGDIDIRADIEPDSWAPAARTVIASKWLSTGNNRSWHLSLNGSGNLELAWSAAGTSPWETATSTAAVPVTSGRLTVRAVLDVSNAGNHTVTFYTGSSVTTATTQLGAVVTVAGVASIFSGTGALEVGTANGGFVIFSNDQRFVGRYYRLQVRDGIGGTIVADPDFTAQAAETTSFSDTYRTWTVASPGLVTSDGYRFRGEVPTWPARWDLSGRDVYVPIEAAGITRRLTQGAVPLRSAIYRNLAQYDSTVTLAYWTFEDDSQASSAASAVSDGASATTTAITFGDDDTLPGAAPVATIDDTTSKIFGSVRRTLPTAATGWSVLLYFKLPAIPGADTNLIRWTSTGTIATWQIIVGTATYNLYGYDSLGVQVLNLTTNFGTGASPNQWIAMRAQTTVSAGTVTYQLSWHAIGAEIFYFNQSTYSGSPGTPRGWSLSGQTALVGASIAHVYIGQNTLPFVTTPFAQSSNGYQGETAVARLQRLCTEEGIDLRVHSLFGYNPTDNSMPMGRQGIDTIVGLLTACQDADLGILYEPRDRFGYAYWPRNALYNADGPTFSYGTHIAEPFEPTDDDQQLRNAVTATRPGNTVGALAELETGPLSILPPPNGVGRYEVAVDSNVYTDDQLADVAAWLMHLGTYDVLRYPQISFVLGNSAFTGHATAAADAVRMDIGRRFTVDSLPAWLPPDPAVVLPQGYAETLSTDTWDIAATTGPAGPYDVGVYDATDSRWDALTTTLGATYASSDTTLLFMSSDPEDAWSTTATPYDVLISGEQMTVTAMTAANSVISFDPGTFESGVAGWTPSGGTFVQSGVQKHSGSFAGLLTTTGSPTQTYVRPTAQRIAPSTEYRVQMWVWVATTRNVTAAIDWLDSGGGYLSGAYPTTSVTGATWTQLTVTATSPSNGAYIQYGPTLGSSPAAGTVLYVDDINLLVSSTYTGAAQKATVTRSVNGVVKALPVASEIHAADAGRWAL